MSRVRLPVSSREVLLRRPTGAEDLLLLEMPLQTLGDEVALALALAGSMASPVDGSPGSWDALCVTDLDALLLRMRQTVFGDRIAAEVTCPAPDCGSQIDVAFGVDDYLASNAPRRPRSVEDGDEAGWFRLRDSQDTPDMRDTRASFRLPTAGDLVASASCPHPERALGERCIRPAGLRAALRRRVEGAMEAMAPSLSRNVQGVCPSCAALVPMRFEARRFCLREVRDQAAFLYEEIHWLGSAYHWPLSEILALPREQRMRLAELARQERSSA